MDFEIEVSGREGGMEGGRERGREGEGGREDTLGHPIHRGPSEFVTRMSAPDSDKFSDTDLDA